MSPAWARPHAWQGGKIFHANGQHTLSICEVPGCEMPRDATVHTPAATRTQEPLLIPVARVLLWGLYKRTLSEGIVYESWLWGAYRRAWRPFILPEPDPTPAERPADLQRHDELLTRINKLEVMCLDIGRDVRAAGVIRQPRTSPSRPAVKGVMHEDTRAALVHASTSDEDSDDEEDSGNLFLP